MITFKSIAILDLETTSLPQNDHNTSKIIELAVLGCEIEHVKHFKTMPRVLHKLVLLFNPMKAICPESSRITGLYNELLMNEKPFMEDDAEILKHFLKRLPSPVCIVAHNGDKFDFPILKRALMKVNKNLPLNIYCADSLKAFREILPKSKNSNTQHSEIRARNETTPKCQKTRPVNSLHPKCVSRQLFKEESEVLVDDQENFPFDHELSEWSSSQDVFNVLAGPNSYKLGDVYSFLFNGKFADAHRAEEDSKALLKCIIKCERFLEWISQNAVTFDSIEPLF